MQKPGSKTVVKCSWRSSSQLCYLFIFFRITDELFCLTPQSTCDHFRVKPRTPHKQLITLRRWAALPHHHAHCTETPGYPGWDSVSVHTCVPIFLRKSLIQATSTRRPRSSYLYIAAFIGAPVKVEFINDISGLLSHEAVRTQQILKLIEIHLHRSM